MSTAQVRKNHFLHTFFQSLKSQFSFEPHPFWILPIWILRTLVVVLFGFILALGIWSPLGALDSVLLLTVVLIGLTLPRDKETILIASLCSLIVLGHAFSSVYGKERWDFMSLANSGLILFIIWVIETIGLLYRRIQRERHNFAALVDTSMEYIGMAKLGGKCFYLNPAGLALVGLNNLEELRQHNPQDFIADSWKPFFRETVIPTLYKEGKWQGEMQLKHQKTGEPIDAYRTLFLVKNPITKAPLYIATVSRDIREYKRVEASLRESEERFRFLAETLPSIVWEAKPNGTITYINQRWFQYTGIATASETDQYWSMPIIHPEDYQSCHTKWNEALKGGKEYQIEVRIRRYDGLYRWFLMKATPRRDSEGKIMAWFGIATDINSQKRMEEQLNKAHRRKDDFLAILAHELRNPLAPIRNAVKLLELRGHNEPDLELSRSMIDRQLTHLTRLIDDLLDVSRITRNKLELRKEPVELSEIIKSAVELSEPLITKSQHALNISLYPQPIYLNADATRLAQVFMNLLNNAAKYTPPRGHITLSVELAPDMVFSERKEKNIIVRIKDNGVGISADILPHVFEMFYQVDRSFERAQGGLGIGLALVKLLVEMHGGTVEAHSEGMNQGSEFVVILPILEKHSPSSQPKLINKIIATHRRILVVDDNVDSAESLATLLKLNGNEVQTAYDGQEALEKTTSFRPEVILLDIGMPKLNGYDVARELRAKWGQDLILIALTGWGQEEDRQRTVKAGFNAHFIKPVDYAKLMELLTANKNTLKEMQRE